MNYDIIIEKIAIINDNLIAIGNGHTIDIIDF
jgi:hypothetical protein